MSRWLNALIKTAIFIVVAHIIFLILGYFIRTDIGIFNMPMWWAHWSDNVRDAIFGIILTVISYFVIYSCFTRKNA